MKICRAKPSSMIPQAVLPRGPRRARAGSAAVSKMVLAGLLGIALSQGWAVEVVAGSGDGSSAAAHPGSYVVRAGAKLDEIAGEITQSTDKATRDRVSAQLFAANPRAFLGGNRDRLRVGAVLHIPAAVYAPAPTGAVASASAPFASLAAILAAFNGPTSSGQAAPAASSASSAPPAAPAVQASARGAIAAPAVKSAPVLQATVPAGLASAVYTGSAVTPVVAVASAPAANTNNNPVTPPLAVPPAAAPSAASAAGTVASAQESSGAAIPGEAAATAMAASGAASSTAASTAASAAAGSAPAVADAGVASGANAGSAPLAASAASAGSVASAAAAASVTARAVAPALTHPDNGPGFASLQALLVFKNRVLMALQKHGIGSQAVVSDKPPRLPAAAASGVAAVAASAASAPHGAPQTGAAYAQMIDELQDRLSNPATWYAIGGVVLALLLAILAFWPRKKKELSADLEHAPDPSAYTPFPAAGAEPARSPVPRAADAGGRVEPDFEVRDETAERHQDQVAAEPQPAALDAAEVSPATEPSPAAAAVYEPGEQQDEDEQDPDAGATVHLSHMAVEPAVAEHEFEREEPVAEAEASAGLPPPEYETLPEPEPAPEIEPPAPDDVAGLRAALARTPNDSGLMLRLAQVLAQRQEMVAFIDTFYDLRTLTNSEGEDWQKVQQLGQSLDPENPLFQSLEQRAAARARAAAAAEALRVEAAKPAVGGATPDPRMASALAALDLSLPNDQANPPEPPPIVPATEAGMQPAAAEASAAQPQALAAETDAATPELVPSEPSPTETIPPETVPTEAPAAAEAALPEPAAEVEAATPVPAPALDDEPAEEADEEHFNHNELPRTAAIAGRSAAKFGVLDLDFDLDLPEQASRIPLAAEQLDPLEVSRNKLALVHEYVALGDIAGARALINEVLDSNDPATREAARSLLGTLAPLP